MIERYLKYRKQIIAFFGVLMVLSIFSLPYLLFSFSFEQFFPQGDEDLDFFEEFIEEFGADDNFLLVAIEHEPDIFDKPFLEKVEDFINEAYQAPHVTAIQSLSTLKLPIRTDEGMKAKKIIDYDNAETLSVSKEKVLNDVRFVNNFINQSGSALSVLIRTKDQIGMKDSEELMQAIHSSLSEFDKEQVHILGRAYFQSELSDMQKREVIISTGVGAILVGFILILLFRRMIPVLIAYVSIGLGLLLFFALLSVLQRELNAIAAFYPVLMLIVGTSDIVHIMSKYIDELKKGKSEEVAIGITIRQIGLATFMTSITTAVGFLSLTTSKLAPIQDFGINSAMGVMIAFVCTILFSCSLLSLVPKEKIIKENAENDWWERGLDRVRIFTLKKTKLLFGALAVFLVLSAIGISKVSTNYDIASNLPRNQKITHDFHFFEKEFAGFRPFEFVLSMNEGYKINDYIIIKEIDKFEKYLIDLEPTKAVNSMASFYKAVNQIYHGDSQDEYRIPEEKEFAQLRSLATFMPKDMFSTLMSKDQRKTRISSRINDLGAENIKALSVDIDEWIASNLNTDIMKIRRTGTGLIIDKNSEYVRNNLIQGLGMALIIISLLMGLMFRSVKMLFISLVPNVLPLLLAAMIIGFFQIELEAVISIVFALIFGIAVDDTIHFLSKYNQAYKKTGDKEKAMEITFKETGKAICFTTIILFFGFMIMLFSIHPPSVIIGLLISITLIGALVADLFILPLFIRKFL